MTELDSISRTLILAGLSLTTDMANGLPFETAVRTGLLGAELARDMGWDAEGRGRVFATGVLRFLGCTAHAHEEARLAGGDDLALRRAYKAADPDRPLRMLSVGLEGIGRGLSPARRVALLARAARDAGSVRLARGEAHCEVGVRLAERLGADRVLATAIGQLHERWDGRGEPSGLEGDAIEAPARLIQVAAVAEHFHRNGGLDATRAELSRRRGTHLDPDPVDAMLGDLARHLGRLEGSSVWDRALEHAAVGGGWAEPRTLDDIARALADFVDLQSVYTLGHSTGVAALAEGAGQAAGLDGDDVHRLRLAGYLHDLGRVSVPTGTWESEGALSQAEWERVRLHPYKTERILASCPNLEHVAPLAGAHHERPDGQGYHRGVAKGVIGLPAMILGAADAYHAMCEPRPHRPALGAAHAARQLRELVEQGALDPVAVRFVLEAAGHQDARRVGGRWPSGLTDREVDVLRMVARGRSNPDIAGALGIGRRTVRHHVARIYEKVGIRSRAGIALFATEHGLL